MQQGVIFDIKKYSIHDGPGIRTSVFLKGCPLACWWCHNPESQQQSPQLLFYPKRCIGCDRCLKACPNGAILRRGVRDHTKCILCGECVNSCPAEAIEKAGTLMTVSQVMQEVTKDSLFFDESKGGVTFTGGEPLMQPDFLDALLSSSKARDIHTAVDTTGLAPSSVVVRIADNTDLFLYDLKHMDSELHKKFTGVGNSLILQNLKLLCQDTKATINVRIPVIPGINDDHSNINTTIDFIHSLPRKILVNLLPYHRAGKDKYRRLGMPYKIEHIEEPSEKDMLSIAKVFKNRGITVKIGG